MRAAGLVLFLAGAPQEKAYRLPSTDLKARVIWGASLEVPDGPSLAFGGQDQAADDGNAHTRIRRGGEWTAIHEELRAKNPLQGAWGICEARRRLQKAARARTRTRHFEGLPAEAETDHAGLAAADLARLPEAPGIGRAIRLLESGDRDALERAAELLDAEPPPRALSPIVRHPGRKVFVIFGGDHLDYLTNGLWLFDPAALSRTRRHPPSAPPPRANHALRVDDGKLVLSGGYTYTSSTDHVGGQYRNLGDGEWTYDSDADARTGGRGDPVSLPDPLRRGERPFHGRGDAAAGRGRAAAHAGL